MFESIDDCIVIREPKVSQVILQRHLDQSFVRGPSFEGHNLSNQAFKLRKGLSEVILRNDAIDSRHGHDLLFPTCKSTTKE